MRKKYKFDQVKNIALFVSRELIAKHILIGIL